MRFNDYHKIIELPLCFGGLKCQFNEINEIIIVVGMKHTFGKYKWNSIDCADMISIIKTF